MSDIAGHLSHSGLRDYGKRVRFQVRPRAVTAAGILVATGLAFAACSQSSTPKQQRINNPVRPDSVNATVGTLRLLAVRIESPEDSVHVQGGNVGLFLTVANSGPTADALTAVSTPKAQMVVFRDGEQPAQQAITVPVPAGGVASLQYPGGPHLELVGLSRDVRGGSFLPVTFTFGRAGAVVVSVFVQGVPQPTVAPLPTSTTSNGS